LEPIEYKNQVFHENDADGQWELEFDGLALEDDWVACDHCEEEPSNT